MLLLLASLAAADPPSSVELVGGLGAVAGPPSAGGTVSGRLWWNPSPRWGLEFGAREGLVTDDTRTLGVILAGARYRTDTGAFARLAFAHHHEVPWDVARDSPVASLLGSAAGIRHRTGLELGAGWDLALVPDELSTPMGIVFGAAVTALPDPHGPPVYGHVEAGLRIGFAPEG